MTDAFMTGRYSGNPDAITTPLVRNIVDCSSGSGAAILVETDVPHLFADHDVVVVDGVLGTTEANGSWPINVIDADSFLLVGSTFATPYSSGGTVTDTSLTPYFAIPQNGDFGTAESIEASIQALADRTQYLNQRILMSRGTSHTFTTSGSFTTGAGVGEGIAYGVGGGGGGAGAGNSGDGGGGGGGAMMGGVRVTFAPFTTYYANCGTGGTGGTGGGSPTAGGDGGDSTLVEGVTVLARWMGAGGGALSLAGGGTPVRGPASNVGRQPGQGGSAAYKPGMPNVTGPAVGGASGGAASADGGGGGNSGWPGGQGGAGGSGLDGSPGTLGSGGGGGGVIGGYGGGGGIGAITIVIL
jgi:hypothetical protein